MLYVMLYQPQLSIEINFTFLGNNLIRYTYDIETKNRLFRTVRG